MGCGSRRLVMEVLFPLIAPLRRRWTSLLGVGAAPGPKPLFGVVAIWVAPAPEPVKVAPAGPPAAVPDGTPMTEPGAGAAGHSCRPGADPSRQLELIRRAQ